MRLACVRIKSDRGSARVSRVGFGVAPKQSLHWSASLTPETSVTEKFANPGRLRQHRSAVRYPSPMHYAMRDICTRDSHNRCMSTLPDRYAQMRASCRVCERALFVSPRIPSELELQARWFAGDFGKCFVSTGGDKIDIIQFGT